MKKIKTFFLLLKEHPFNVISTIFWKLSNMGFLNFINDKTYIKLAYFCVFHKRLNLVSPKTFNEKIQWLKIYDRKPIYKKMVDKYEVKRIVSKCIGEEYIIPTLGIWDDVDEIDWNSLPNSFVLKTTNGSGGFDVIICKDKNILDKEYIIAKLKKSLDDHAFWFGREWPYKDLPKRIIAEKFMFDSCSNNTDLTDYKFYCFNGKPTFCQVIRDRRTTETIDFYDMHWQHMPFVGLNPKVSNGKNPVPKPIHLDKMVKICQDLTPNIPFARVDLYLIDDAIYFGEITFYPASGFGKFTPDIWDYKIGEYLNIEQLN